MTLDSVGTPVLWLGFTVFVVAVLVLDLSVFHRKAHAVRMREALLWTGVWIGTALLFNLGVYLWFGAEKGLEFLTDYRGRDSGWSKQAGAMPPPPDGAGGGGNWWEP